MSAHDTLEKMGVRFDVMRERIRHNAARDICAACGTRTIPMG